MLMALVLACTCGTAPEAPAAAEGPFANVAPAVVSEALTGDGRSYLHVKEAAYTFWVSVPAMEVSVGDHLLLGTGPLREHVHSAELGRDFDVLTEIAMARIGDPAAMLLSPPPGGHTIESVYARKAELAGKPVKVRGRVVKANHGIFDKNWYHLQDGTGAEGRNDLTVTTLADAKVGDTVVAEAPLVLDRDLGFGYFFAVILEDATVTVEGADAVAATPTPAPVPIVAAPASVAAPAPAAGPLTPLVPKPRKPGLPAAPTRSALGLDVGTADEAAVAAWASSRKLTCVAQPASRRDTRRTECNAGLDVSTFPERKSTGKYTQLLLSRTETGPTHYLSLARRYSIPGDAGREFESTLATLKASFGEPTQLRPFDATKLSAKIVRFAATWNFDDLDLTLSLFRASTDYLTVTETWAVPGIEEGVGARPGSSGHGGGQAKPAGWNPHVVAGG